MSMTPEQQAKLMDLLDGPGPFDLGVRFERERIIKLLVEEGVFCDGHWAHECEKSSLCSLPVKGGWHGVSPCEWDFMGGNECKRVIELIKGEDAR